MNEEKIVITGMGAVTPIGIGVENFWEQLINGACGIGPLTRFDASGMNVQIGAEVKNFKAEDYIPNDLSANLICLCSTLMLRQMRQSKTVLWISSRTEQVL